MKTTPLHSIPPAIAKAPNPGPASSPGRTAAGEVPRKTADIVIRAIDVSRFYGEGDAVTKALNGISLDVFRGEYLSG